MSVIPTADLELRRGRRRDLANMDVALIIPLQGPAGLFGPSCELCALLAAEEINCGAGVLGRELRLIVVDGGRPPQQVADEVDALVSAGLVDAVVGWHISAVRQAVAPRIAGRVPYVYTALYEGGESTPGVFLTGETPAGQILPAMRWISRERGARRWSVVGDDYVWPRGSARAARTYARKCGLEIRDEIFVPLGTEDFASAVRRLERTECDAVLMLLVGDDAVLFNRQFAAAGLDERCVRFSPLMEENMLLASGPDNSGALFSAAGYFESLPTAGSLDFNARFARRFGPDAPVLNSLGESCYEGLTLLSELHGRAGTTDVAALAAVAATAGYDGPRGSVSLRDRHLDQTIYLAQACGVDFDVVCTL